MAHPLSFKRYKLKNGVTVYWQKRNMPWDAVSVLVWAGFRYERPEVIQVAHVLEHLMTCGTADYDYPTGDIVKFRDWCLRQGFLSDDADTWSEAMEIKGHTTRREHLPKLLRFMSALVLRPSLDRGLEKEREIIRAENDAETDEAHRDHQLAVDRALYGDSFILRHESKPTHAELDAITMADVREHHARLFHPVNMAVVVISGQRFQDYCEMLESFFAVEEEFVPSPEPPPIVFPPLPSAPIVTGLSRKRKCNVELQYNWRLPVGKLPYLEISRRILGSVLTSRIREKLRGTYDVEVDAASGMDYAYLNVSITLPKAKLKKVMNAIRLALKHRRGLEAAVEPELIAYDHDGLTIDFDALESIDWATGHIGKKERPPPILDITQRRERLKAPDILAFMTEHFRHEDAVIGILEIDN